MPNPPERSYRETVAILSGILLGSFLFALNQTIVAAALPRIAGELGGVEHLSWIVTAFLLTSTATAPLYGRLSDLFGRRATMSVSIVLFVAASILCGLARDIVELSAARALQGVGGGGLWVVSQAVIGDIIAPRERGRYQGIFAAMWAIASVGGPLLGGILTEYLSWRWVFWINLPLGVLAFLLCQLKLRGLVKPPGKPRIDYAGSVLLIAAVSALQLVAAWGGLVYDWASPQILGLAALGLAITAVFLLAERFASSPIMPLHLFRNRSYVLTNAIAAITSMAFMGGIVFMPLYAQLAGGVSAAAAGLLLVPYTLGSTVGAMIGGRFMSRTGRYRILPIAGLIVTAVSFAILARSDIAAGRAIALTASAIAGIGLGILFPVLIVAVQNAVAQTDLGAATAAQSFFRSLGSAYGVALLGAVFAAGLTGALEASAGAGEAGAASRLLQRLLHEGHGALAQLPEAGRAAVVAGAGAIFRHIFDACAAAAAFGCALALLLKELPLRRTVHR